MAYNFFNLEIIGTEIKRRLDMLKDITGTNKVASTDELESEVSTLNQSITNTSNELNASINATKLQFNSSIKKAINLKDDGTSYVDAGNVLDINDVPDVPDTPDDDIDLDNYDIILEVEQVKSDVDNIENNINTINNNILKMTTNMENVQNKVTFIDNNSTDKQYPSAKAVNDAIENKINSGVILWEGSIDPNGINKDFIINNINKYNLFIIDVCVDEAFSFSLIAYKSKYMYDDDGTEIRGGASYIMGNDTTPELIVMECEILFLDGDTVSLSRCVGFNVVKNQLFNLTLKKVIGII